MNDLPAGLRLYRTQIADAIAWDLERRRRPIARWAVRLAVPTVAAAAAAIAAVALTSGPQAPKADAAILRGVAAALTPHPGTILHERALVTVDGMSPGVYELWEQSDSPYAYRVVKLGHEGSWDGTSFRDYDAASNRIVVQQGRSGSRSPDDTAAELRLLVESGRATIDEETTFQGVPAYKLTVSGAPRSYLNGTVFVAKADYRPLEIRTTTQAGPEGQTVDETIDFQAYEYLPSTQANLAQLDLAAQHPGAQVVDAPAK